MRILKRIKAKLLGQKPIDHDELLRIYMNACQGNEACSSVCHRLCTFSRSASRHRSLVQGGAGEI
jgi:hypothetical protein